MVLKKVVAGWARFGVLDSLVRTILSQNTTDKNASRAYAALKIAFPSWEDVSDSFFQVDRYNQNRNHSCDIEFGVPSTLTLVALCWLQIQSSFCQPSSFYHSAIPTRPLFWDSAFRPSPLCPSAIMLFCRSTILPFCYSSILPFRQIAIQPSQTNQPFNLPNQLCHSAILPFCQSFILPFCHPGPCRRPSRPRIHHPLRRVGRNKRQKNKGDSGHPPIGTRRTLSRVLAQNEYRRNQGRIGSI